MGIDNRLICNHKPSYERTPESDLDEPFSFDDTSQIFSEAREMFVLLLFDCSSPRPESDVTAFC